MANVTIAKSKIKKIEVMVFADGETGSNIIKKYNPDYLINLGLYDMDTKKPLTMVKDEGEDKGYLFSTNGFGIDGNEIVWANKDTPYKDFIGGSPTLLKDRKVNIDRGNKHSDYVDGTHYRSVVGINSNSVFLLATDYKLSIDSLATTCLQLGMNDAINCDGGGSCFLYANGKMLRQSIRANSSWLLIRLKGDDDKIMINEKLINSSKRRCKRKLTKLKRVTIHSTGNTNSTAMQERNWLENPSNKSSASWHLCVDENEVVKAIPLDEVAYHSGTTTGNNTSIGIEICESGNREKTLRNAIKLVAEILEQYKMTTDNLKQHYDWNGKNCPSILRNTNKWNWFIEEVDKEMGKINATPNKIKYINAQGKEVVAESFIINNLTYAPVRQVAEASGKSVVFNDKTKEVVIK